MRHANWRSFSRTHHTQQLNKMEVPIPVSMLGTLTEVIIQLAC